MVMVSAVEPERSCRHPTAFPIMTTTCLLAWAVALLLLPLIVLAWATESRPQRARRWRRQGLTQQAIADRLGISRSTVRRLLTA
jgi:hypothetical protein